jgi:hypothetical protein
MDESLGKISCEIEELKNIQNLEHLMKKQETIKKELDKVQCQFDDLKKKIGVIDTFEPEFVSEEELKQLYEEYNNAKTIEEQIARYNFFYSKVCQCKEYLQQKKLEIIKLD